jgi:glutamate N-acetyltransferase / amino-acid N-acetyltransferase
MSVTAARGFVASGVACGIKPSGDLDLALVAVDPPRPVSAAATFTTNGAAAAPVRVSESHLRATKGRAAAVVLNSGCANAATGAPGLAIAETMCALTASALGVEPRDVLVCSTGLIGIPLPQAPVAAGIPLLVGQRSPAAESAALAALAIMTTDRRPKTTVVEGDGFTVGAMAKGAAMLAPNMATMLAVLTTDATIIPTHLRSCLRSAVSASFNELTIDGCTSTNDTVIVLSSGLGREVAPEELTVLLTAACQDLAQQMALDAEGATKVVRIEVLGARTGGEARRAASKVAQSQLVQCSLHGGDPYWGRVVSELGSAGIGFESDLVEVAYGSHIVCRGGVAAEHDALALALYMGSPEIDIRCELGLGDGAAVVVTTDLSAAYIDENMRTS